MTRPNFIFIVADDLGYADLGCYGARSNTSPNLDELARNGMILTNGYSNSPVCSPTRFALMTGRYQYRFKGGAEEPLTGVRANSVPSLGYPADHPSLASLLRDGGYRTGLVGKWHLGSPPNYGPLISGYEEHFGSYGGGLDYFSYLTQGGKRDLWDNGTAVAPSGYITDLFSDKAVDFVERATRDAKPFFLSLHYTAPHWPWQTREDEAESRRIGAKINHPDGGSVETYRTMIRQMDEGIGKLVASLKALGQFENTLIVFTSDNGGERFSDNWPLIGGKMDLTEGGIRVPYVVHWPAGITGGTTSPQLAITMDWVATILDIANVEPDAAHPLDGISLLPHLKNPETIYERELFWRMKYRGQWAMRSGKWKYLAIEQYDYLFNMDDDQRERANVSKLFPEQFAAMRDAVARWGKQMPEIPADAEYSLVVTEADMPHSHRVS